MISRKNLVILGVVVLAGLAVFFLIWRRPPLEKYRESKSLGGVPVAIDVCLNKGADAKKVSSQLSDVWQRLRESDPETGGAAIDAAVEVMRKHGFHHFLIGADEDVYAAGHNCHRGSWKIAIRDPWKKNIVDVIAVSDMSVSNYFDPNMSAGATVLAPKVREGRALAKKIAAMPAAGAVAVLDAQPKCAGILITGDGQARVSIFPSKRLKSFSIKKSK